MMKPNLTQNIGLPFTILVGLMLVLVPIEPVIEVFELRPYYSLEQLSVEVWRLLSGHFAHASWLHLAINLLNLILLRFVFREWVPAKTLIVFIIFSALFISIGLWTITNLTSYVGFSGIFHGLLIYLLLLHWQSSRVIFSIAAVCVIGKVIYEQLYGASSALAEFIGVGVAIDSHALGTAAGLIFYLTQITFSLVQPLGK
ncbi:MAG: rhomboid family GlyGly-CTERM serine protease [Cellvibrionaceae bacterium]|jgi:rhomboid family GlyGly-CTERM serine protease